MFSEQLKKILELSKRSGDRVVIFDSANPDDSYIISHLDKYLSDGYVLEKNKTVVEKTDFTEKIAEIENLTEEDLTDKINREISMWKNQANASTLAEEDKVKKSWQIPPAVKDKAHNIE